MIKSFEMIAKRHAKVKIDCKSIYRAKSQAPLADR